MGSGLECNAIDEKYHCREEAVKEDVANTGRTPAQRSRLKFGNSFNRFLETRQSRFKPCPPHITNIMEWSVGSTWVALVVKANMKGSFVGIDVHNDKRPDWYERLEPYGREVEAKLGQKMERIVEPGERLSQWRVRLPIGLNHEQEWETAHEWMLKKMEVFDGVLRPVVLELTVREKK